MVHKNIKQGLGNCFWDALGTKTQWGLWDKDGRADFIGASCTDTLEYVAPILSDGIGWNTLICALKARTHGHTDEPAWSSKSLLSRKTKDKQVLGTEGSEEHTQANCLQGGALQLSERERWRPERDSEAGSWPCYSLLSLGLGILTWKVLRGFASSFLVLF